MQRVGRHIVFLFAVILATASAATATQLGPAVPSVDHREVNLGVGYFYHEADLDDVTIEQDRIYLHIGYGLGIEQEPRWEVYFRGGAADMEAEGFDGDFEPFAAAGLKGAFCEGEIFSWGLVVQGGYYYEFEDDDTGIEIEDYWEIEAGLPFQAQLGPLALYAGPVFFHADADAESSFGSTELDEENNVGGFGGLRLELGDVSIEGEAQYKSDFSAGGLISVHF